MWCLALEGQPEDGLDHGSGTWTIAASRRAHGEEHEGHEHRPGRLVEVVLRLVAAAELPKKVRKRSRDM